MKVKGCVVLEGPDGAGKTTLGTMLADRLEGHYFHATWTPEIDKDMAGYHGTFANLLEAFVEDGGEFAVLDRWWPSETAYASVFRDPMRWDYCCEDLDKRFESLNGLYLLCLPERETLLRNLAKKEADGDPRPQFNSRVMEVYDAYDPEVEPASLNGTYLERWKRRVKMEQPRNVMRYDYSIPGFDYDQAIKNIVNRLKELSNG